MIDAFGDRLCAVYRQKDAGTTETGEENFLDASRLRRRVSDIPYLARHEIYFGHYPFGIHHRLSRPGVYLSLMRAPLERLVSGIKHVTRHPQSRLHPLMVASPALQDIIENHRGWQFDNLATRMFSGLGGPGYMERVHFEHAVRNVTEHFAFVGHQGLFDASLSAIFGVLGHDLRLADYRLNVAPPEQHFDISRYAASAYVDRLLQWDLLLEQFILDRFWARRGVPQLYHTAAATG